MPEKSPLSDDDREPQKDDNVVGEPSENLYPIRYTAGWSIVYRLSNHPTQVQLAPWTALAEAAGHVDPQLAAPALLALGNKLEADADGLTPSTRSALIMQRRRGSRLLWRGSTILRKPGRSPRSTIYFWRITRCSIRPTIYRPGWRRCAAGLFQPKGVLSSIS